MKWWEIKFSDRPSWDELGWLRTPIVIVGAALVAGIGLAGWRLLRAVGLLA